jgi:hypothetical protein
LLFDHYFDENLHLDHWMTYFKFWTRYSVPQIQAPSSVPRWLKMAGVVSMWPELGAIDLGTKLGENISCRTLSLPSLS